MPKARRTPSPKTTPKPDTATLDAEERAAAPGQPTSKPVDPPGAKAPRPSPGPAKANAKVAALEVNRENADDAPLTTNTGVRIEDDQNSLRAGVRGPSLLEDFHLREKITHFDHERIPERIVHSCGAGAHGFFQVGSSDLARDVRGFAVKFYTEEGNFDLVGNNIPVFFIQDAVKFPDFVKPIAATGAGAGLLEAAGIKGATPHPKAGPDADPSAGVVTGGDGQVARDFIAALGAGRQWARGLKPPILA